MKKVLSTFNDLLKGNKTLAIACIEDRTEWTISPKDNVDQFIESIKEVCNDAYGIGDDDKDCKIVKAEEFDYGYSIEIDISIPGEDDKLVSGKMYLYHANRF